MNALPAPSVRLEPHPASPWATRLRVDVAIAVSGSPDGPGLLLDFRLTGPKIDRARLHVPGARLPGPADGLWQDTCFELFVASEEQLAYREFNFSPSGQWAAYAFSGERQRDPVADMDLSRRLPDVSWHNNSLHGPDGLLAWVPASALPATRPWVMGLSAVLASADGQLAYLALHHPQSRPDFHDRRGWTFCPDLPPFPA
ncbi:MAG: DOMON-like domain-containing protein [Burkholderiaceae bacterium]